MGDMSDDFAAMKAHTQAKHAEWKQKNMNVLSNSGAVFTITNNGETLLFRMTGYPKVDFYPSTGRWRIVSGNNGKPFRGGAAAFLTWYKKQAVKEEPNEMR
jgi:hypothetical protein